MNDGIPVRVVGMGPVPLPDENKQHARALENAKRLLQIADDSGRQPYSSNAEEAEHEQA